VLTTTGTLSQLKVGDGEGSEGALSKRLKLLGSAEVQAERYILIHNIFGKHVEGFCNIAVIPKIRPLLANLCAPALSIVCPNMYPHQHHRYTHNRHSYCPLHVVTSLS